MHNLCETKSRNQSVVDYLIEFLSNNEDWQYPHKYTIMDYFPINKPEDYKPDIYKLYNLKAECDNGHVIFDDAEGILSENVSLPLQHFLLDDVDIKFQHYDKIITISMSAGYIQIRY